MELGILIGVLSTLVIGMGTFIIYDKILLNDSNQQEENQNDSDSNQDVIELSLGSDLVKELRRLSGSAITTSSYMTKQIYSSSKLIKDLPLDVQEKLLYIQLNSDTVDRIYTQNYNQYFEFYGNTVKSLWHKLFGLDTTFKLSGKTVNGLDYQNDGSVKFPSDSGRFEGMTTVIVDLRKATQSDKEIVLYEAVKFCHYDMNTDKLEYFLDVDMTQPTTLESEISINYKKVFKKDSNGNYYFYGVER